MPKPIPVMLAVRELGQGGCERDLTKLASYIDRDRFEPHVGCFRPGGIRTEELKQAGVPVFHIPVESFKSPGAISGARAMGDYLRRHGIQLIQAFDVPLSIFGAPVAKFYRTPVVITSQLSYRSLVPGIEHKLLRVADRFADAVIVNCKAMERHMIDDEGVRPEQVQLCYNGIDTSIFYPGPVQKPASLADAEIVVGVVCALRQEKDLPTLVRGFAKIAGQYRKAKLLIVGSGPVLPQLESEAQELGIQGQCVFVPARPDVADWLRAIDIFVLPSISEAFSNALMESMACGCTPVASRVGGSPELVIENETGLLFTPRDADGLALQLRRVIEDVNLRKSLASRATEMIHEKFTLQTYTTRMENIYSDLLDRSAAK